MNKTNDIFDTIFSSIWYWLALQPWALGVHVSDDFSPVSSLCFHVVWTVGPK